MHIVTDIILVALFILAVVLLTKSGLAKALQKVGKKTWSLLCSALLGPWVSERLMDWFLRDAISGGVYSSVTKIIENSDTGTNLSALFDRLPDGFVRFLNGLGVNIDTLAAEYGDVTHASEEVMRAFANQIATPCINVVSTIIGYVVTFIAVALILWWITRGVERSEKKFFKVLDKIGGFLSGCVLGYCVTALLSIFVFTMFQVVLAFNAESLIMDVYNHSYVFKFLKEFDALGYLAQFLTYVMGFIS